VADLGLRLDMDHDRGGGAQPVLRPAVQGRIILPAKAEFHEESAARRIADPGGR
jgi:hypothetical protein